jgi:hypothetical protein
MVAMHPASLAAPLRPRPDRILTAPVSAASSAGVPRTLPPGTVLQYRGRIAEGEVWSPVNRVLTAEGWDAHEGWIVLSGQTWIGFYLPVESAFSPLSQPILLTMEEHRR